MEKIMPALLAMAALLLVVGAVFLAVAITSEGYEREARARKGLRFIGTALLIGGGCLICKYFFVITKAIMIMLLIYSIIVLLFLTVRCVQD